MDPHLGRVIHQTLPLPFLTPPTRKGLETKLRLCMLTTFFFCLRFSFYCWLKYSPYQSSQITFQASHLEPSPVSRSSREGTLNSLNHEDEAERNLTFDLLLICWVTIYAAIVRAPLKCWIILIRPRWLGVAHAAEVYSECEVGKVQEAGQRTKVRTLSYGQLVQRVKEIGLQVTVFSLT